MGGFGVPDARRVAATATRHDKLDLIINTLYSFASTGVAPGDSGQPLRGREDLTHMGAPRLRHIAICTKDPAGTAAFYEAVFGLKVVASGESDDTRHVFCTDGSISIALLDFKTDEAAAKFNVDGGASYVGLHHIGFMVEDANEMLDHLQALEIEPINERTPEASEGVHFEAKIRDPNGIVIDIGRTWPGLAPAPAT